MTWGFVDITLLAMQEIQTIDLERHSTIRQLPLRTTVLVKYWAVGRRNYRRQFGITEDEDDEESWELSA